MFVIIFYIIRARYITPSIVQILGGKNNVYILNWKTTTESVTCVITKHLIPM